MTKRLLTVGEAAPLVPAQDQRAANTPSEAVTSERIERADDPITLAEACKLFPRANLKVSTLRAEAERKRLKIFPLGRRDYTTEVDMRAWVKLSRGETSPPVSTGDDDEQARSAAAALSQITSALKRST